MSLPLRVLTLNCWGIPSPFGSSDKPVRFQAIAEELSTGMYDIVCLQEVFGEKYYRKLVSKVSDALPYQHYFYSGFVGSGICVLSKHPIVEACQHVFTLNGYPHKHKHCDWYAGSLVGLCRIQHPGAEINLYATHPHAEYDHDNDEYRAHRVSQAFELSQFIRNTGQSADVNILAGDFNNQPFELGLKIIQSNTGMHDAWLAAEHKKTEDSGITWNHPDNGYSTDPSYPPIIIDYVFYKGSARFKVKCVHCETTMHKIPGKPFNYSDHEGVLAHLELEEITKASDDDVAQSSQRDGYLRDAITVMEEAMARTAGSRWFYAGVFLICLIIIFIISHQPLPLVVASLLNLPLSFAMCWSFWMGVVVMETERRGLLATKHSMEVLLSRNLKKKN